MDSSLAALSNDTGTKISISDYEGTRDAKLMIVGTLNKIAIAVVDDRLLNMIPDEYEIDCFSPDRIVVFVIPEENFEHISESIGIITQNDRSSKKIVKVGLPVDANNETIISIVTKYAVDMETRGHLLVSRVPTPEMKLLDTWDSCTALPRPQLSNEVLASHWRSYIKTLDVAARLEEYGKALAYFPHPMLLVDAVKLENDPSVKLETLKRDLFMPEMRGKFTLIKEIRKWTNNAPTIRDILQGAKNQFPNDEDICRASTIYEEHLKNADGAHQAVKTFMVVNPTYTGKNLIELAARLYSDGSRSGYSDPLDQAKGTHPITQGNVHILLRTIQHRVISNTKATSKDE